MKLTFFKFEIAYRLKRPETYLFFIFLFLFSLFGVEFVFEGVELGLIKKNSPIVVAKAMGAITGFSMLLISIIMGIPILRDFQLGIASLFFSNPIEKRDYYFGKYFGSLVILLLVFSAVLWGTMLGQFMPWINADDYGAFKMMNYCQPFLWVVIPILLFAASVFFMTGALTKNILVVYIQGLLVFVVFMLTKAIETPTLQSLLDPFSLTTLSLVNKEWSVDENNTLLIPFEGIVFWKNMLWFFLGLTALLIGYKKFKLNTVATNKNLKRRRRTKDENKTTEFLDIQMAPLVLKFDLKTQWKQFIFSALFHVRYILKQSLFWAIVICAFIILIINSINLGMVYNVKSLPTTYLIVAELTEMSIFFFMAILLIYTGELMWSARQVKLDYIIDSMPIGPLNSMASKFLALFVIYTLLLLALMFAGMTFQILQGYCHFDFKVYWVGFFVEILPFLILYTIVAFFFQSLCGNKFLGMAATMLFFLGNMIFGLMFKDYPWLNFGGHALVSYSEMNQFGHFLKPFLWVKIYWFIFGLILLILAAVFKPIGIGKSLISRWRLGFTSLVDRYKWILSTCVFCFLCLGVFIFYNTHILNQNWSHKKQNQFRANYEKSLKSFENILQPKIVDVKLDVELYPSSRSYEIHGMYKLVNCSKVVIDEIHVQKKIAADVKLDSVYFDRKVVLNDAYRDYFYSVYNLDQVLEPGDTLSMDFHQSFNPQGFEIDLSNTRMVFNGSFFDNSELPQLGYGRIYELKDEKLRTRYDLPTRESKAKIDDTIAIVRPRSGSDSGGIWLDVVIGTDPNQTAVTSGNLIREWTANDRNYFHYQTAEAIINFYSILTAEYTIVKQNHKPKGNDEDENLDVEIYYHEGHASNIDRMISAVKNSIDYHTRELGAYPYDHLRIVEFPRYREFAQSFPGVIPFSEALGFVMDIDDALDVDMVFYITAHEVAHQWWGIQLEAANVQGQNFIIETLAQYSAMMVFKEKYGVEKLEQFLENELIRYSNKKDRQVHIEPPLQYVTDEDYVYYSKGAINMYAFQKLIGEDNVNLALRNFYNDWKSFDNPNKPLRYATSEDLICYFRSVTPELYQEKITELFEEIGLPEL